MLSGPLGIVLADQGKFTVLASVGDGPARYTPCVATFLDRGVVQTLVSGEPFIKPAVTIAGELNPKLVRTGAGRMRHSSDHLPKGVRC